jgi:hypothetical protein
MIDSIGVVCDDDLEMFHKKVASRVKEYQRNGLEVEIQYQMSTLAHSAMIIGRERMSK